MSWCLLNIDKIGLIEMVRVNKIVKALFELKRHYKIVFQVKSKAGW